MELSTPAPGVQAAVWPLPDGARIHAVWSTSGTRKMRIAGAFETVTDFLGNEVKLENGVFDATPGILYFRTAPGAQPEFKAQ